MSLTLLSSFNQLDLGQLIQIQVSSSSAGLTTFTYDTSTSYFPMVSGSIDDIDYVSFYHAFRDDLNNNGYGNWTFTYSMSDKSLVFNGNASVQIVSASVLAENILGIRTPTSPVLSITNSVDPMFIFKSEFCWSKLSWDYEDYSIVREEKTDDGRVFAQSNEDNYYWLSDKVGHYKQRKWKFVYEPISNVFNDFTNSINLWPWQSHLNHNRSAKPFVLYETSTNSNPTYTQRQGTYKIVADASNFKNAPSINNIDQYWDVPVVAYILSNGDNFQNALSDAEFLPSDLSGLLFWYDASNGIILSGSSTTIAEGWLDQSGNNYNLTASRPQYPFSTSLGGFAPNAVAAIQYVTGAMNGLPVMRFTGANTNTWQDWGGMVATKNTTINSTKFSTFVAGQRTTGSAAYFREILGLYPVQISQSGTSSYQDSGYSPFVLFTYQGLIETNYRAFDNTTFSASMPAINTPFAFSSEMDGFTKPYYQTKSHLNGLTMSMACEVFATTSVPLGFGTARIYIGNNNYLTSSIPLEPFDIGEFFGFNRELTDEEYNLCNQYLVNKYNL